MKHFKNEGRIWKAMLKKGLFFFFGFCFECLIFSSIVPDAEVQKIGEKIFLNECKGDSKLLAHWNKGENFGSFGIGHFIWYPEGVKKGYTENFPNFLSLLKANKIKLPNFLQPDKACPWKTREEFYKNCSSENMICLRKLLNCTKGLQMKVMAENLKSSIIKIKKLATQSRNKVVEKQLSSMLKTKTGLYPLIDYVNFKGDGTNLSERYNNQGWGLFQVLENMKESNNDSDIVKNYAISAKAVLKRRVKNAPNKTQEQKWLMGWIKRIDTYTGTSPK